MPEPDKKFLWTLLGKARAAQRKGASYNEINEAIRFHAKKNGIEGLNGLASLENMLNVNQGKTKGRGERLRESVANIADKAALGYGGEIRGALRGGVAKMAGGDFGETYQAEQAKFDELAGGAKQTSPLAAGIGTAAGYGANALAATAMLPAGAGTVAARGSAPLRAQILGGGVRGAIGGALGGALEGASTPGLAGASDRLQGAIPGAMWGGAFGGALGAGLPAILGASGAGGAAVSENVMPAAERKATGLLGRALDRAKIRPERLPDIMREVPEGTRIGDLRGSMRRYARAARNIAPDLEDTVEWDQIIARHEGQTERMISGLREAAELPSGYRPKEVFKKHRLQWLEDHLNPIRAENPKLVVEGLPELVSSNRFVEKALKQRGADLENIAGPQSFDALWGARQRLLRWGSKNADRFDSDQLEDIWQGVEDLTEMMENTHPGTKAMLAQYRHIKAVEEAFESGLDIGGKSIAELDDLIKAAGDNPEIDFALKQGLAQWFEQGLEQTGAGGAVANKLMSLPPRTRAQLNHLFKGKQDKMVRFIEEELRNKELRWSKLNTALRGNSTTPMQLEDIRGIMGAEGAPHPIKALYDRIYVAAMTNIDFSRDVAFEFGKQLLGDLSDAEIRRITDTMIDLSQQTGLTARGIIPTGAAAAEFGPSLFGREEKPKTTIF